MVDRFEMEVHSETVHSRGDCCKERQPEDHIPKQQPVQKALEHRRRPIQGMSIFVNFRQRANIAQNQDVSYTYGCLDPVMVTQMAKYLDTVYVSGWQASSTASSTDEPGPDLADYPYVSKGQKANTNCS